MGGTRLDLPDQLNQNNQAKAQQDRHSEDERYKAISAKNKEFIARNQKGLKELGWKELFDQKQLPEANAPRLAEVEPEHILLKDGFWQKNGDMLQVKDGQVIPKNGLSDRVADLALELLQYQGVDTVRISYQSVDHVSKWDLYALMNQAEKRGMSVDFEHDSVKGFLASNKLSREENAKLIERMHEVNAKAAVAQVKRKHDEHGEIKWHTKALASNEKYQDDATRGQKYVKGIYDSAQVGDDNNKKLAALQKELKVLDERIKQSESNANKLVGFSNQMNEMLEKRNPSMNLEDLKSAHTDSKAAREDLYKAISDEKNEVTSRVKLLGTELETMKNHFADPQKKAQFDQVDQYKKMVDERLSKLNDSVNDIRKADNNFTVAAESQIQERRQNRP